MSNPPVEGFQWVQILVRFNFATGKSEIMKSYSYPAKESQIKQFRSATAENRKKKAMNKNKKIDILDAVENESKLF